MKTLLIEWKHFNKGSATCERCSLTGDNLKVIIKELKKKIHTFGINIEYRETKLTEANMDQSNQVIIDGMPIENLVPDTVVDQNYCSSCSGLIANPGSCNCRTIKQGENTYEAIPKELIKTAILNALNISQFINSKKQ